MGATSHLQNTLEARIRVVEGEISAACHSAGRPRQAVRLVAASKTQSADTVQKAYRAGLTEFGENYLQEALSKIRALSGLPLVWHYIGSIQSNKTAAIAAHFDWVHTVSRVKIAQRLSQQRGAGAPLNVCLQVNIDNDPAKSGVLSEDLDELIAAIVDLPNLKLRGLMTILSEAGDAAGSFRQMRALFDTVALSMSPAWDTLSMGMTQDLNMAVAAGSTLVRIGTAIFGERTD
ncbi:MAG: YggS family pyridoxal phosphate-dependent enzyme [Proteobacteria bacterium]|nr:YggS family pyridoxal phosphate-dependent enzyme [Pseudomonadota bacterium]